VPTTAPPQFRLFGFPVTVRVGFLVFLGLIVLVNGPRLGAWMALFIAVFTLVHELGHALAARRAGATASITLDFLYGYAAYTPTRKLSGWAKAGISIAGPAAHIVSSVAVIIAVGFNPFAERALRVADDYQLALLWAGPVIGALNLIPVLPLDGGHIVEAGLRGLSPRHGYRIAVYSSLAISAIGGVMLLTNPRLASLAIFLIFPVVAQLQMLGGLRSNDARHRDATLPSMWQLAASIDDPLAARQSLIAGFDRAQPWTTQQRDVSGAQLQRLLDLLPDPLPHGHPSADYQLADVLLHLGEYRRAAHYSATAFEFNRHPLLAVQVARAAAALGDSDTAAAWVRTSMRPALTAEVRDALITAPELSHLVTQPG
jgi:Zn-dependent protease